MLHVVTPPPTSVFRQVAVPTKTFKLSTVNTSIMPSRSRESLELQNATVVDGTGRPAFDAHVLVDGDRIRRVGPTPAGADRTVDLDGSYLAPGFIDMHAHSELQLLTEPSAEAKVTQGITLEVLGQDGVSVAPVPPDLKDEWARRIKSLDGALGEPWPWTSVGGYLDALADAEPAVNAAYYAPHGNLRSLAAGFDDRPLDSTELSTMRDALRDAFEEGAFALSKGMIYPPSSYARDDELEALAATVAERDSFVVSHVWNETDRVVESIRRYFDICDRAGCHAHVSHLKVGGKENWGLSADVLDALDDAVDRGQRVTFDQYPYTAGSTMLTALLPPWARRGDSADVVERLADEQTRERIAADIDGDGNWENLARAAGSWDNILVTNTASGAHEGETVEDIAAARDNDPIDAMCDLLLDEDLDVTMADFIMSEDDIERFLADDRGTFCTDGIFGGKPHPRVFGSFPRILGRYVRDRDVLSVERMVYKAAGHPARILGLPDRGHVAEGYVADLVAFDLDRIDSPATYEAPARLADGVEHVLVNGSVVVEDGEQRSVRAGRVLRAPDEWGGETRPTIAPPEHKKLDR